MKSRKGDDHMLTETCGSHPSCRVVLLLPYLELARREGVMVA